MKKIKGLDSKEYARRSYERNRYRISARRKRDRQKRSPKKKVIGIAGSVVFTPIQTQNLPVGGKFEQAVNKILGH
jgi:hypothetical protein